MRTSVPPPDPERRLERVLRHLADDAPYSPGWAADVADFEELALVLGLRGDPDTVRRELERRLGSTPLTR
jgi:hypothetical protein